MGTVIVNLGARPFVRDDKPSLLIIRLGQVDEEFAVSNGTITTPNAHSGV